MAESLELITERFEVNNISEEAQQESSVSYDDICHPVFGATAKEHLENNPTSNWKEVINIIVHRFQKPAPSYQTKVRHQQNGQTTITTRVQVHEESSYSIAVTEFEDMSEFWAKKRKIQSLSEHRAVKNLLTMKNTTAEKTEFEKEEMSSVRRLKTKPSHKKGLEKRNKARLEKHILRQEAAYVVMDIERTGGAHDSEVLQVALVSGSGSQRKTFNRYLKIKGEIDRIAARNSHQMKIDSRKNLFSRSGERLDTVSQELCISELLEHLKNIRSSLNDTDLTLVTYGDSDLPNLTNFLDSHGKYEEYKKVVPYHVDFHFFLRADQDIVSKTGDKKTGLSNSSETGILKIVTGNKPDQDKAHDALYDAEILHDLMFKYLKSGNWYHETMGSFRMNAVTEINYGAIGQGLVRSRRRRVKNPSSCGIFYPPGFASFK